MKKKIVIINNTDLIDVIAINEVVDLITSTYGDMRRYNDCSSDGYKIKYVETKNKKTFTVFKESADE